MHSLTLRLSFPTRPPLVYDRTCHSSWVPPRPAGANSPKCSAGSSPRSPNVGSTPSSWACWVTNSWVSLGIGVFPTECLQNGWICTVLYFSWKVRTDDFTGLTAHWLGRLALNLRSGGGREPRRSHSLDQVLQGEVLPKTQIKNPAVPLDPSCYRFCPVEQAKHTFLASGPQNIMREKSNHLKNRKAVKDLSELLWIDPLV